VPLGIRGAQPKLAGYPGPMDEALQQAMRSGGWLARAKLLRRSSRDAAARRVVEEAVRTEEAGAVDLLEAWYPLDPQARALLGDLEEFAAGHPRWGQAWERALELLGDSDPRLHWALENKGLDLGDERFSSRSLLEGPYVERLLRAAEALGHATLLNRARPTPDEALRLAPRLLALEGTDSRVLALAVVDMLLHWGDERGAALLESAAEERGGLFAVRARAAAAALGSRASQPLAAESASAIPPWAPKGPPARTRDGLTLCWRRASVVEVGRRTAGAAGAQPQSDLAPRLIVDGSFLRWVLLFDVDRLRVVQDSLGCDAGDRLLLEVAAALQEVNGDRVIRYSGDEFLVLVEAGDADELAVRSLEAVRRSPVPMPEGRVPSVSCGVTPYDGDFAAAFFRAEQGLVQAKESGRDRRMFVPLGR
jgi:diguanylate cyclase (GGDEF)-like protein